MDELIITGYCRKLDGNRVMCLEYDGSEWATDCLYPECEFASSCKLMEKARQKIQESEC